MSDEIYRRPRAPREESYETPSRAPLFVRLVARLGIAAICLAGGYYGTDLLLKMLEEKEVVTQENVVANMADLQHLLAADETTEAVVAGRKDLTIYLLGTNGMAKASLKILADVQEDEIVQAVKAVFSQSSESWANVLEPKHVYRDGLSVYIDLPRGFSSGLEEMEEQRVLYLLTGIVRTVVENFPPIKQVYFLEDGRWIPNIGSLRLSDPWGFENKPA